MKTGGKVLAKIGIRTVVAVGVVLAWMWVTRAPGTVSSEAEAKLKKQISVHWENKPLGEVLAEVETLTAVQIRMDWERLRKYSFGSTSTITYSTRSSPAADVVEAVLNQVDVGSHDYRSRGNVITAPLADFNVVARLYDIENLRMRVLRFGRELRRLDVEARSQPQRLMTFGLGGLATPTDDIQFKVFIEQLVMNSINPHDWVASGGKVGTVNYAGGKLLVVNTPRVHQHVRAYLEFLEGLP